jgi:hypothetical protein
VLKIRKFIKAVKIPDVKTYRKKETLIKEPNCEGLLQLPQALKLIEYTRTILVVFVYSICECMYIRKGTDICL